MRRTVPLMTTLLLAAAVATVTDAATAADAAAKPPPDLAALEHALDRVEISFWSGAAAQPGSKVRESAQSDLDKLAALSRQIQQERRPSWQNSPGAETLRLKSVFNNLTPAHLKGRRPKLSRLTMRDYRSEFTKDFREKENERIAAETAKSDEGDRRSSRRNSRVKVPQPTLMNVDIVHYESWIADTVARNNEQLQDNNSDGKARYVADSVQEYCSSVSELRLTLVRIAQGGIAPKATVKKSDTAQKTKPSSRKKPSRDSSHSGKPPERNRQ